MIHFMVTELADHSEAVRPDTYRRYLRMFLKALHARPDAEGLGEPLSEPDTRAIVTQWIATHRNRSR